jgi:L-fuconolactonase
MSAAMPALDAQLHVWDRDRPDLPWSPVQPANPAEAATRRAMEAAPFTYDTMLGHMDAAGVLAAILVTPGGIYGFDNRYSFDGHRAHPDRFAVVARTDHRSPTLARDIRGLRDTPGCVGVRIPVFTEAQRRDWRDGAYAGLLAAAAASGLPVCIYPPGLLAELPVALRAHPDLDLVVDHLGALQPPLLSDVDDGFAHLDQLLALADHPRVSVKLSGVHDLSRTRYPFPDTRAPIRRVINAFGAERVMWGSDWTRDVRRLPYASTIDYLRESSDLTALEKRAVLGGTLRRIFNFDPIRMPSR